VAKWMQVKLVDPVSGEVITEGGHPGELRIKGPTVFPGYLPASNVEDPFDDEGYLRTGDLLEIVGDELQYLRYVDRTKDLVVRRRDEDLCLRARDLHRRLPEGRRSRGGRLPRRAARREGLRGGCRSPGETPTLDELLTYLRELGSPPSNCPNGSSSSTSYRATRSARF